MNRTPCLWPGCNKLNHGPLYCLLHRRLVPTESLLRPQDGPLDTPCQVWTGATGGGGYGRLGGNTLAHRWCWEKLVGPIPDGRLVLHRCDNPPCCNPEHLFLGTNADNSADKVAKGRHSYGAKAGTAKLTDDDVRAIRTAVAAGSSQTTIAGRYGVDQSAVSLIVHRKRWAHI